MWSRFREAGRQAVRWDMARLAVKSRIWRQLQYDQVSHRGPDLLAQQPVEGARSPRRPKLAVPSRCYWYAAGFLVHLGGLEPSATSGWCRATRLVGWTQRTIVV